MSSTRALRNNRSSRYSSPATFGNESASSVPAVQETIEVQHQSGSGNANGNAFAPRQWVEPAPRHAVASFEDTRGLERVGVLEHMQPLGVAPNQKLLQRLKVNYARPGISASARATPVYSEGVASPSVEPNREDIASPIVDPELLDTPPPPPQIFQQSSPQSQQYYPQMDIQRQEVMQQPPPVVMSPPRGRPAKREVEEMKVYPDDIGAISPSLSSVTQPRQSRASPRYSSMPDQQKEEMFKGYLRNAINKASHEGKYDVAAGLTKVMDEAGRDELLTALENISKSRASVRMEQFKVFKHYVKKGVRKHRRDSTQSSMNGDYTGPPPPIPPQQRPVAYVSSFHANIKRPSPPGPVTYDHNAVKSPLTLRMNYPHIANDTSPPKLSLHSPSSAEDVSMDHLPDQSADQIPEVPKKPSPRKRRTGSDSSGASTLTDPPSDIETFNEGHWPVDNRGGAASADTQLDRSADLQRQAPNRAASGRVTRLSGMDQQQTPLSQLEANNFRNLNTINKDSTAKRQKLSNQIALPPDYDQEEIDRHRREFQSQTRDKEPVTRETISERSAVDATEGTLRSRLIRTGPPPPMIHPNSLVHATINLSSPATAEFPPINGTSRKRDFDEFTRDDSSRLSSPSSSLRTSSPNAPPPPITSRLSVGVASTRASTPRAAKEKPLLKGRKQPRTMISPRKPKNGANISGAARAGAGKDATTTNGIELNGERQDNEDECRACGDEGLLLLCEGCPNSFHGECLEPPVNPEEVEDEWFCPECEAKRRPNTTTSTGFMGVLVDSVHETYPRAYTLPADVRNYFENVKTGDEGEYVEVIPPPTNKKGAPRTDNNGAMKPPNYKEVKDKHNNLRLCYKCGLGTGGDREMMPCDYCPNEWHLDCLDPPVASIPKRFGPDGKVPQPWRCPLHVEGDLAEVGRSRGIEVGQLGRRPRLRRPKHAVALQPKVERPVQTNNGIIDVVLDPEEPELNIKTIEMHGTVMKLPERNVIQDFIRKAHWDFYQEVLIKKELGIASSNKSRTQSWLPDSPRYKDRPRPDLVENGEIDVMDLGQQARVEAQVRLAQKSFPEQQALMHLTQLAAGEAANGGAMQPIGQPKIDDLVNALIAEAPTETRQKMMASEAQALEELMRIAQKRLDILNGQANGIFHEAPRPGSKKTNDIEMEDARTPEKTKLNGTLRHDHSE